MGVCIVGMVGDCGNKSSSSFASNVSIINQAMTNMVSSTSSSSTVHNFNVQNNSIEIVLPPDYTYKTHGPPSKNCVFSNVQNMNASQKVSVSLDVNNIKDLRKQISTALKTENDQAVKQKSAFLQTASNSSSTATTVNEAISNLVSTNISESVRLELKTLLDNAQNNNLKIPGPVECSKENPTLSSNIQNMVSSQIVDSITKALTKTTLSEVMGTTSDIKNKGKNDEYFKFITNKRLRSKKCC